MQLMPLEDAIIRFQTSKGKIESLPLPENNDLPEVRFEKLARVCQAIAEEWKTRLVDKDKGTKGKPRKTGIQRACYQLILHCLQHDGLFHLLERRAKENGYRSRDATHPSYRFQVGLDAIFLRTSNVLTPNQRTRLINEMWCAFRHYIPHFLFNGFTHECGGGDAIGKAGIDNIEPDFRTWIVDRRVDDGLLRRVRGTYDKQIETAVRQKRRELRNSEQPGDLLHMIKLLAEYTERRRRIRDPKGLGDPLMHHLKRGQKSPHSPSAG